MDGAPGITLGSYTPSESPNVFPNFWTLHGQYVPTLVELMVVVGMISFGVLLFIYLSRKILMGKQTESKQSDSIQFEAPKVAQQ